MNGLRRASTAALQWLGGDLHWPDLVTSMFWGSPVFWLAASCFLAWVLPLGIAYWLVPSQDKGSTKPELTHGLTVGLALSVGAAAVFWPRTPTAVLGLNWPVSSMPFVWWGLVVGLVPAVAYGEAWVAKRQRARVASANDAKAAGPSGRKAVERQDARNVLTLWLRTAVMVTAVVLVYAVIDSLGQTLFVVIRGGMWAAWITALGASLLPIFAALAVVAQRLGGVLGGLTPARLKIPVAILAGVVAISMATGMLAATSAFAHWLTWEAPPAVTVDQPAPVHVIAGPAAAQSRQVSSPAQAGIRVCSEGEQGRLCVPNRLNGWRYIIALGLAWLLALAFGHIYSFINRSSLSELYGRHLARAFIGASNPNRDNPKAKAFNQDLPGDDMELRAYRPHEHHGPLHLINVTINETFGGGSQVEQRDRKGLGMAIGPAGASVGARHHATWASDGGDKMAALNPTEQPSGNTFRVFPRTLQEVTPRWPTLGRWMAISGAAVSTGLGSRTSLSLAFLVGIFNFRLGHWFGSGVEPAARENATSATSLLGWLARLGSRALPVQARLMGELLGRFPGTSAEDWYLTDGGHFENTGAYELIRRRLRTIIVCDNGADPDGSFQDLAGLVRKARVDFGANIHFCSDDELRNLDEKQKKVIGTLGDLGFSDEPSERRAPRKYAALGHIVYCDGTPGTLLVLRPGVLESEPLDVRNYHRATRGIFPQQPTADQFFDEAQWESYRRLGECMATTVFETLKPDRDSADPSRGWCPLPLPA